MCHDEQRLEVIFSDLARHRDDSQQRSWALHEDHALIACYLEELLKILVWRRSHTAHHRQPPSYSLLRTYRAPSDNSTHTTQRLISHIIILIHPQQLHSPPPSPFPGVNHSVSTTAAQRSDVPNFDRIRWTQTTFQIEERGYGLNQEARQAAKYVVFVPAKARIRVCLSTGVRLTGRIIPCCPPPRRRCRPYSEMTDAMRYYCRHHS